MATTTHNVDIRMRETGSRVIKRRIDDLGLAANNATRGIFLMQRALFVLGGAGLARGLARQVDTLTNYENRLRLTATSAANLEVVQRRLFNVAREGRTSFEAVAEIYSRTALSVRQLGVSQAETLRFTESLSKATIISGASSREAHAALVQLGQGMASNTLRGDELRSVLEQLPYVADIISQSLGVTRGELRVLGAEGKISAETILKAFREAEEEIDTLFANTIPTISQALSVANSEWLEFLDRLDDATGGSEKLARGIIAVSKSLDDIVAVATTLGSVLVASLAGKALSSLNAYRVGLGTASIASTKLLTVETARATADVRLQGTLARLTALRVSDTSAVLANLTVRKAQLQQTVLDTQFTVVNGQARNIATGQFIGLSAAKASLAKVTQQLTIVEQAEIATSARLTAARTAAAAATLTAGAATARLTVAQKAQAAIGAQLAAVYPILVGGIRALGAALKGLLVALGPLGILVIAITAASFALKKLGDASATVNKVVDATADIIRQVGVAMREAEEQGKTLAQTFNDVSIAQLKLQRVEGLDAQRDAVAAVTDQLEGWNSAWQNMGAMFSGNSMFVQARSDMAGMVEEFQSGSISAEVFSDRLANLAAEVGNEKFTDYSRTILDTVKTLENADDAVAFLEALIAELNGTANASQQALLVLATGISNVASAAGGAASAIQYLTDNIPALAKAAEVTNQIAAANSNLAMGLAEVEQNLSNQSISFEDAAAQVSTLVNGTDTLIGILNGSTEAFEDGAAAADQWKIRTDLAAQTGLGRTLLSLANDWSTLNAELVRTGQSQEVINQAEANYQSLINSATLADAAKLARTAGSGSADPTFAGFLAEKQLEITLLRLSNDERVIQQGLLALEDELKRSLTQGERELASATLDSVAAAQDQSDVLQSIIGPREDIIRQQEALNALFEQGDIGLRDYTDSMKKMQEAAGQASGTLGGAFKASISSAIQDANELGNSLGKIVVSGAEKAADAIVEFAKTGKLNIKQLFSEIFAQIAKLLLQQVLLKSLSFLGLGFSGGGSIGPQSGVPSFASGGSINPTGPGSTDSQLVQFAKRPDERVDILTPGQQAAQRNNMNGNSKGSGGAEAKPNNVKILNVLDPAIVGQFMDTAEGETMVMNILTKNGIN